MNNKQYDAIMEYLDDLDDSDILSLVRDINGYDGSLESLEWFEMEYEFDELLSGMSPWDIARAVAYGDFVPGHDYWRWNGYGNLESTDWLDYDESDKDEIINAIDNLPYRYIPDEIRNILDENEDDGEEEEDAV